MYKDVTVNRICAEIWDHTVKFVSQTDDQCPRFTSFMYAAFLTSCEKLLKTYDIYNQVHANFRNSMLKVWNLSDMEGAAIAGMMEGAYNGAISFIKDIEEPVSSIQWCEEVLKLSSVVRDVNLDPHGLYDGEYIDNRYWESLYYLRLRLNDAILKILSDASFEKKLEASSYSVSQPRVHNNQEYYNQDNHANRFMWWLLIAVVVLFIVYSAVSGRV